MELVCEMLGNYHNHEKENGKYVMHCDFSTKLNLRMLNLVEIMIKSHAEIILYMASIHHHN